MANIWFWQRMITPHQTGLAVALAERGHSVTYLAEESLSSERSAMGWTIPKMRGVEAKIISDSEAAVTMARSAPAGTIHLTQGLRSNGLIGYAQSEIRRRRRDRQYHYVIMETVRCYGVVGLVKRGVYAWHLQRWASQLDGIMAIGYTTVGWLRTLAPASLQIHPFAYFLPQRTPKDASIDPEQPFRFLFVGQLNTGKRVDLLLSVLSKLESRSFELIIVGDGPEVEKLQTMAAASMPGRCSFLGTLPIEEVPIQMAQADCLVLPSIHDGWGAVVSEAMLVGTPVVCSAACGAAGAVRASGEGGVFESGDIERFGTLLQQQLDRGRLDSVARVSLQKWAACLGAREGAAYVERILEARDRKTVAPPAPWTTDELSN